MEECRYETLSPAKAVKNPCVDLYYTIYLQVCVDVG